MFSVILGNFTVFLACIAMFYSSTLNDKKKILFYQIIQFFLFVVSDIILGGITGAIINTISIIRNILCYKDRLGFNEKIIITLVSTILSLKFNNLGLLGLLPIINMIVYVWFMDVKDIKKFKLLVSFTLLLWLVYDFNIKLYFSSFFDIISIIANIVTLQEIKFKKEKVTNSN